MTHVRQLHPQSVTSPSQIAGVPLSVLAQMLKDRERREHVAARIRQLWEESGRTEPEIAEEIGLSLRGYQKAKQTGGISREKLEKLAEFHDVTPEWILTGREKGQTPDPFATMNGSVPQELQVQLDRIEESQKEILNKLAALTTRLDLRETVPPRDAPATRPAAETKASGQARKRARAQGQ